MDADQPDGQSLASLKRTVDRLCRVLAADPRYERDARLLIDTLDKVVRDDRRLREAVCPLAPRHPSVTDQAPTRRRRPVHYRVVRGLYNKTALLSEERPNGRPVRCPWGLYEWLAEQLSRSERGVTFTEVLHAGERDHEFSRYMPRVCLRFWMSRDLVVRSNTRYRVRGERGNFVERAREAWGKAPHDTDAPRMV